MPAMAGALESPATLSGGARHQELLTRKIGFGGNRLALAPQQNGASSRRIEARLKSSAGSASSSMLLELVPERKKESLSYELPLFNPSRKGPLDLVVVGGGPAGLAVAARVSAAGLSVCCIDPCPLSIWPNNYGVWVDEFEALDLLDCLDHTWASAVVYIDDGVKKFLQRPYGRVNRKRLKAKMTEQCIANGVQFLATKVKNVVHDREKSRVACEDGTCLESALVLDATGFSKCLVQYDQPFNPGYQVAYGIVAEVDSHPFDLDKMVFMDWRDSHLAGNPEMIRGNKKLPTFLYAMPFSSTKIFLEETSLVARPGVPLKEIQKRMEVRLRHLGIHVKSIEEDEVCVIPMGGVLPVIPQRVLGIGGTAGLVHPSTGYMVARTLAAAPVVADAIVRQLGSSRSSSSVTHLPDDLSAEVWADLWPIERKRQREFFCFGMDILLKLDLYATRRFFSAFFDLEPRLWQGFLSSRLYLPELVAFGLSLFAHAPAKSRLEIMAKGTPALVTMVNNLITTKS
ncbi:lycopene beta cyclase, chloroplastic [Selaginella moellendorffii]|nr:lycopene beta cyclase, chloroplastic [Selaginella moellendorffii]|eukprot:XP_002961511.2 lycopene beta cyclase, chloroplastic [Selaginella moellendorffii]